MSEAPGVRTTVYMSKELREQAELLGINISGVLQRALREAVEMQLRDLHYAVEQGDKARDILSRLNGNVDLTTIEVSDTVTSSTPQ